MERRRFSGEFKREAIKLASQVGVSKSKVAQELGLNPNVLTRWVREARDWKLEMATIFSLSRI